MTALRTLIATVALILTTASYAFAADLTVTLSTDRPQYAPGDTVIFGLQVSIPEGYHFYSNPLGPGIGLPTVISVRQSPGLRFAGALKSPPRKYQPSMGGWVWAYDKSAIFFVKAVAGAPGSVSDTLVLSGLMCKASCVKLTKPITYTVVIERPLPGPSFENVPALAAALAKAQPMELDTGAAEEEYVEEEEGLGLEGLAGLGGLSSGDQEPSADIPQWTYEPQSGSGTLSIWLALVFAFIAGIILNVMPCVLPVLGVKVLTLAQGHGDRKQALLGSLAFTAGMLAVFMGLASLAAFAGFSWGQQFQDPKFLVGIICFIFFFALGMFDLYIILVPSKIAAQAGGARNGLWNDALAGVFATVLATPCSGPFLGATLAWTLTQPPAVIYLVFLALGLGMASPYIVLTLVPALARMIPKPGEWMNDFKHVMGFLLIGFAIWLMIGLPRDMVVSTVGMCAFIALAIGLYGRLAPFGASTSRKTLSQLAATGVVALGLYLCFGVLYAQTSDSAAQASAEEGIEWQEFTAEALEQAHEEGRTVMVDFTANWCMNCQYNMIAVLQSAPVKELIEEQNILPLVVDLTSRQPVGESLLHHLGSRSVPFLAIFPAKDPNRPIVLRDVLSRKQVVDVLEGAK